MKERDIDNTVLERLQKYQLRDNGPNGLEPVDIDKLDIKKIFHAHTKGGSGGIAFNYVHVGNGRVYCVVWATAEKRANGNMYRWRVGGKVGYVPYIPNMIADLEDHLRKVKGSCFEEEMLNSNNDIRDDSNSGGGSASAISRLKENCSKS